MSTHPGCGSPFQWIWYSSISCPETDDICVKVIERKDGMFITFERILISFSKFAVDHFYNFECRSRNYYKRLSKQS